MSDSPHPPQDCRRIVIWIDISDLFWFFGRFRTPTGIQRLTIEAVIALNSQADEEIRIGLCRVLWGRFVEVSFAELLDLVLRQPTSEPFQRNHAGRSQLEKVAAEFRRFLKRRVHGRLGGHKAIEPATSSTIDIEALPGDVLMCMGSHWIIDEYPDLIRRYRTRNGLRFILLCYDLIPLLHRQWVPKSMQKQFRNWFDNISIQADVIMTISHYTAAQVQQYFDGNERSPCAVVPIRIGHGFPATANLQSIEPRVGELPLNIVGAVALFVSTIEPRKNHIFLVRVWQRLLREYSYSSVPQLVFVGRRGPLAHDLFGELENSDYLNGKVTVAHDVADPLLSALYARSTLAVYPSLEEGFGLPVAEAVLAGAICVASSKSSIPEVVGDVIDYFDPDEFDAAYRLIERAIFDDSYRAELRSRAERFVPRSWNTTAQDILSAIERHALSQK